MVAADRERIAVAAEREHVQIRPAQGNAAGKGQDTSVNVVGAMRLHKIGKRLAQPMPATVVIFSCQILRFSIKFEIEARTEKSPQPGHQVG